MDTQPIFDFLSELEQRSLYVHPVFENGDDEKAKKNKVIDAYTDYLVKLKDMKGNFETCVSKLVLENPSAQVQLGSIANRLNSIIQQYRNRRDDATLSKSFSDSQRAALLIAEEAMKSFQRNYGAFVEAETIDEEDETRQENKKEIITGIRELAKVLGVGVTKANAIVQSGILEKEKIQWNEGFWKFDKTKLLKFKEDNPNAFSKIKCTR